jgi:hypothetical protein
MRNSIVIFFILVLPVNMFASETKDLILREIVSQFIENEGKLKIDVAELNLKYVKNDTDTVLALFYNHELFVACDYNNLKNPVLAFSFNNGIYDNDITEQIAFLKALYKNVPVTAKVNQKNGQVSEPLTYGPLLESLFGQTNCHDESGRIINVTNLYTPGNVAVGCVAISMATALHFNKWPAYGSGTHSYSDNKGNMQGKHSADFSEGYSWGEIQNRYNYVSSTIPQRQALGQLAYHAAVALEMDFENGGSTSNINRIPDALTSYFNHYGEYADNKSTSFFNRIDSMIIKKSIVPLAVSGNGYAHSVVCDGLKITDSGEKYNHLNMGWWGTTNGWYQIHKNFNAGGYSSIDGGVFNIVPTPKLTVKIINGYFDISWSTPDDYEINGYILQIKKGRSNWETLAELKTDTTYQTEILDENLNYAFRVRMKYNDFKDVIAWSNMEVISGTVNAAEIYSVSESINIYPNPAKNYLFVDCNECGDNTSFSIFNISGVKFKTGTLHNSASGFIDIHDLSSGKYFIQLINEKFNRNQLFIKN